MKKNNIIFLIAAVILAILAVFATGYLLYKKLPSKVQAPTNEQITDWKVYKNNEWQWGYREIDELNGHDPYSNSKSCAELVASSYINSFFQETHHHSTLVSLEK